MTASEIKSFSGWVLALFREKTLFWSHYFSSFGYEKKFISKDEWKEELPTVVRTQIWQF